MQITQIRIAGFKSFVDPTDVPIEEGLTGIVGPNGCGKSNLLEALRWAMGASSAKAMRGAEMDDLIFSGSADRPARETAEVTLVLDNSDRTAPPEFNS
ncbi:MAG: AAA family ATPase, partial [Pseudomonadota bacterium]